MIDTETYLSKLTDTLKDTFADRLVYIGLQGSYLRGEADAASDFDVMLVIEGICPGDLDRYRDILISLGHYDISCGFVCGRDDLLHWNPMEICHVLHTTRDVYGKLAPLMPAYTAEDVKKFVKISVNNLYHELCHRRIHCTLERNIAALPGTYQPVFFILQNLHWLRTGDFVQTKCEMLGVLPEEDRAVLHTAMRLKQAETFDFDREFDALFGWCRKVMKEI